MAESEHDWISRRAYALWEEEGYPTGKDAEHWERARQEYLLFAPRSVKKGLPGLSEAGKNGATGDVKRKAATKSTKSKTAPASTKVSKPALAKQAAAKPSAVDAVIAADATGNGKKRSKKLAAE